jgi:fructose-bisphosphate aldolase class II
MLVSLKEVLDYAEKNNCAIGAFNTPNLEMMIAVLETAEKLNTPVIISHAQLHEPVAHLKTIGPVMVLMASKAKVPVCVHLDHAGDFDYIKEAIEIGFTSVMYDGSLLSFQENVKETQKVVAYAHARHIDVEAEIGAMPNREAGAATNDSLYTVPSDALTFVKDTNIDALAASFGTAHGIYKVQPKLDFERIKKIHELVGLPLVMHGGSGVPADQVRKAISLGIKKVNYYSYMSREGVRAAKKFLDENDVTFYHDVADIATKAMAKDAENAMKVFLNK